MSHRPQNREVETTAARWLARSDRGLAEEERRAFDAWLVEAEEHASVYRRLEQSWRRVDAAGQPGRAEEIRAGVSRRARIRRHAFAGALAAVLLLVGVIVLPWSSENEAALSRTIAILGPERSVLPDGSVVEYALGTYVEDAFEPALRRVLLSRGIAHFEVQPDPARPFVVVVEGVEVRAVGTAFSVNAHDGGATVVVTHGRVAIGPSALGSSLSPKRFFDAGQGVSIRPTIDGNDREFVALEEDEVVRQLAWREQRVEFSGALLADVLAVVNSNNREQFLLADPVISRMPLSGVFRLNDPEDLARMLERAFEVSVERREDGVFMVAPRR